MYKRLLFAIWLLAGCGPTIPRKELLVVTKVVDDRFLVAGKSNWYFLPKDSTVKVGDTLQITNLRRREKATYPRLAKRPR